MAQVFHRSTNTVVRTGIVAAVLGLIGFSGAWYAFNLSYGNRLYIPIDQPVQFSHKHHVADDGIDCRYCHTSVEKSAYAGMPATQTCMSCHSQIWSDSPELAPVRASYVSGQSIQWNKVHDMPDFVYFNHSIHLKKGISCVSCHGRIDKEPLAKKVNTMTMQWCLDCHKHPERFIRPREQLFNLDWKPTEPQSVMGPRLVKEYKVLPRWQMTNCSICHH